MSTSRPRHLRYAHLDRDKNGDLVFTFTDEELRILGVQAGDLVDFEVKDGRIYIKKAETKKPKRPLPKMKKDKPKNGSSK